MLAAAHQTCIDALLTAAAVARATAAAVRTQYANDFDMRARHKRTASFESLQCARSELLLPQRTSIAAHG
jgi:hypothetical protein